MVPENEVGVIILFAQQAKLADFEIVSAKSAFPDAIVEKNGQKYKVEFEYKASNFLAHGHDVRAVDLIVCWENDYADSILPVLALSEDNWPQTSLDLPTHLLREATYWKQRALLAEQRLETSQHEIKTMRISMKSGGFQ